MRKRFFLGTAFLVPKSEMQSLKNGQQITLGSSVPSRPRKTLRLRGVAISHSGHRQSSGTCTVLSRWGKKHQNGGLDSVLIMKGKLQSP